MSFQKMKEDLSDLIVPILAVFLTYCSLLYFQRWPEHIKVLYEHPIYQLLISKLSMITGLLSFSLAEFLLYAHVIALGLIVLWLIFNLISKKWSAAVRLICRTLSYLCVLYCLFMWLWGFNYVQTPLAQRLLFDTTMLKNAELEAMCLDLVAQANTLRDATHRQNGLFTLPYQTKELMMIAKQELPQDGGLLDFPSQKFGTPKPVLMSTQMLYTGITGIYVPFTGEANVNIAAPDLLLPATALHEMAHQWGHASEDEANFVAFLASRSHKNADFKYSGTVLALIYSVNALHKYDPEAAKRVRVMYSDGLKQDLNAQREFWLAYEGEISEAAEKMNDRYLKFNGQTEGIESYGRMVDLMIGYWRMSANGTNSD